MYKLYNFHFLDTVSKQLLEAFETLGVTQMSLTELEKLRDFQRDNRSKKGIYLLHHSGKPVYLGKADDIAGRLQQHYKKISGRKYIDISIIGFKCIILDESMSTAANEELLISLFQKDHTGMWNSSGFGAKDPGKERDQTKPGGFDQLYPIESQYGLVFNELTDTIGNLMNAAKQQLPYVFRYELPSELQAITITISHKEITAEQFVSEVLVILGPKYQGNILSFGITMYAEERKYTYGRVLRHDI